MSDRDPMTEDRREALERHDIAFIINCIPWEREDLRAYLRSLLAQAAPPSGLDVERLARAMTEASPRRVGIYAEAEAIVAEYARLSSEPTETGS